MLVRIVWESRRITAHLKHELLFFRFETKGIVPTFSDCPLDIPLPFSYFLLQPCHLARNSRIYPKVIHFCSEEHRPNFTLTRSVHSRSNHSAMKVTHAIITPYNHFIMHSALRTQRCYEDTDLVSKPKVSTRIISSSVNAICSFDLRPAPPKFHDLIQLNIVFILDSQKIEMWFLFLGLPSTVVAINSTHFNIYIYIIFLS
jgi:hypothetical protein